MSKFLTKAFITQSFRIPSPTLTEKNLPSQSGRVVLITGGYAGVGRELAAILYASGATVYVAGRSEEKGNKAISEIKANHQHAPGRLEFLLVDLNDLASTKPAVESFTSRESRLDVLVNNAGVMFPPKGSQTKQGHDLQFGTNVLGPFLLTKLLMGTLVKTATASPPNSVRVLWAASSGIQVLAPKGGVVMDEAGTPKIFDSQATNYGQTKVANVFFAVKMQRLFKQEGVLSVSFNPGNLQTELQRHSTGVLMKLSESMLFPAIYGAYTELYCGWSKEITTDRNISYIMPWGRDGTDLVRSDIQTAIRNGLADRLWEYCDSVVKDFV